MTLDRLSDFDLSGYAIVEDVLGTSAIGALLTDLASSLATLSKRGDAVFGARNLLTVDAVQNLAYSSKVVAIAESILGQSPVAVRSLFFDKTTGANWPVAWHQDLNIAVAQHCELTGWVNWTVKAGVCQVQPPASVLENMLTLRFHLDDCWVDNGCLRVIPGSHRFGRLSRQQILEMRNQTPEAGCPAATGSVLMMRPLLLHASSPALRPSHRRVVHIEYARQNLLPSGVIWARL